MKLWTVKSPNEKLAAEFKSRCDLSMLVLRLMTARGVSDFSSLTDFFGDGELSDPFTLLDMDKAVEIINEYIDSYKLICVYGDYDCDGVTATALLYSYLQNMGANVIYYINERAAGYGMNMEAVRSLSERGVELIVTVDNGISCVEEAAEIERLGMKLVITDHHQPPELLPAAAAVVNPHQAGCTSSFKPLAGVGVALKLCAALDGGDYTAIVEQYADICSIGTVGDIVPLVGENRTLVRKGLMYLKNTESQGLREVMEQAQMNTARLTAGALAFQLCPKINAAGRFASPLIALETLLTEDPDKAKDCAAQLMKLNETRRQAEAEIFDEIKKSIDAAPDILNKRVLVLCGRGWHHGVIGIVSSKVLEAYGKPNVIISIEENGEARGSARSLKGFNIHSCFTHAAAVLIKHGGHECAGGLSLREENIPEFIRLVDEYADSCEKFPAAENVCDMEISPQELTVENIASLETMQPFGAGNPQPLFYMPRCEVKAVTPLSGGKHSRVEVAYGGRDFSVLVFSTPPQELFFGRGSCVDIAAHIDINEYNGRRSVSIKAVDIKPHGMQPERYIAARDSYEKFKNGIPLPQSFLRKMTPDRRELVAVYKLIAACRRINVDTLFMKINHPAINYCKLRLMIDIFCEAGLTQYIPSEGTVIYLPAKAKVDLGATSIMRKLQEC